MDGNKALTEAGAAGGRDGFYLLLQRLRSQAKFALLDEEGLESFVMAGGDGMVLFTQEPEQQSEVWNIVAILHEVLKRNGDALRAAVITPELARKEQARFGITHWPSLVFVREGRYVGAVDDLRNLDEFALEIAAMLEKTASIAPSAGIPEQVAAVAASRP